MKTYTDGTIFALKKNMNAEAEQAQGENCMSDVGKIKVEVGTNYPGSFRDEIGKAIQAYTGALKYPADLDVFADYLTTWYFSYRQKQNERIAEIFKQLELEERIAQAAYKLADPRNKTKDVIKELREGKI